MIGNPLAALGCWLVGATVHMGRVLVTAETPQERPALVGCMSSYCGTEHATGSCVEAIEIDRWSEALKLTQGLCSDGAHETPRGTLIAHVLSLKVELTFFARIVEATWDNADM